MACLFNCALSSFCSLSLYSTSRTPTSIYPTLTVSCSTSYRPQSSSCHRQRWRLLCLPTDTRQDVIDVEICEVHKDDEEWQEARREESRQLERRRQVEREEERKAEGVYRSIANQLKDYPIQEVAEARKFVARMIKSGEGVEEMIEEASESGELTPLVLLVIRNRLELARHDDERDAMQALDLLYRRVEMELLQKDASMAMILLNQLLNLHDGFSHEEWLRRSRTTMLQVFVPEDAFTILGASDFDMENQMGPIEIPEEDEGLLRIDFIREVDELISELETEAEVQPVSGFDAQSVAVRLRQQEKLRAIQQVKDLRHLAATLKW
ncbi:protein PALE CRESS, chloroplastic [Physcomitrium patens]|uniref:Protein PALE CRESS, chloroplastic n=1 Tax=Physcomitrium patens TaxID=3218 RepID=A0A2K1KJU3_PHYPA|nr:protein PALE CRESS, chloroplastic-like [Physcomitrium patens]PNR54046.1 hypothetical protein PHYPA_007722 [Physcomitrium patens]|eukprot:XP_024376361.1 protein PALE CRESS, chloroplastic-like [Physcomitrella patens]